MPHGPRTRDPVERARQDAVRERHGELMLYALAATVVTPAFAVAVVLWDRYGWRPDGPWFGLSLAGGVLGGVPLTRWVYRRNADPARDTARNARVFGAGYTAALVAALGAAWAGWRFAPGGWFQTTVLAGAAVVAVVPFVTLAVVERRRPQWLLLRPEILLRRGR